jgi:hypothetical protein
MDYKKVTELGFEWIHIDNRKVNIGYNYREHWIWKINTLDMIA